MIKNLCYTATGSQPAPKLYPEEPPIPEAQAKGLLPTETKLESGKEVSANEISKVVKAEEKKEEWIKEK
jgi:hypothetical protein